MKVRLLIDVVQAGVLKTVRRNGREPVIFSEGNVVEMSDTSAQKYIRKGWAEEVKDAE